MPILLSLDFETSGLDFEKDRVIEIGAVLFSTGQQKCLDNFGRLVNTDVPITQEITGLTGIHQSALDRFGYPEDESLEILQYMIETADFLIGHNVLRFDKFIYEAWCRRSNLPIQDRLWIDTMIDIRGHEGKKLSYLAADHGILNLFPHSAMADCQTVLAIANKYDIDDLVKRANTPTVIVRARTTFDQNELVKKAKFRWYPKAKFWWKAIKETDLDELEKSVEFDFSVEKDITLDELDGR